MRSAVIIKLMCEEMKLILEAWHWLKYVRRIWLDFLFRNELNCIQIQKIMGSNIQSNRIQEKINVKKSHNISEIETGHSVRGQDHDINNKYYALLLL